MPSTLTIDTDRLTTVKTQFPAPRYSCCAGSSLDNARFKVEMEFQSRNATSRDPNRPRAHMKSLSWQNESGAEILKLTGTASPKMLCDLAGQLRALATKMEKQQKTLDKLIL